MRLVCALLTLFFAAGCAPQCTSSRPAPAITSFSAELHTADPVQVHVSVPHALAKRAVVARLFLERAGESGMTGYVAEMPVPANSFWRATELHFVVPPYRGPGRYDLAVHLFGQGEAGDEPEVVGEVRYADAVEIRGGLTVRWAGGVTDSVIASPTVVDVNGDGVLDVIVGTGLESWYGTTVALDGRDGSVLWRRDEADEMISSPAVADLGGEDGTWLFNGGRAGRLVAIRSSDGATMWYHDFFRWVASPAVADMFGDGRLAVVATAGGSTERFQEGRLTVFDARTGDVRWSYMESIDGQEYYASPAVGDVTGNGFLDIVIGSGGERVPGATILFEGNGVGFHRAWEAATESKGVEASPLLVDTNGDGTYEVVTATMDGVVAALRGTDGAERWRRAYPGFEFYPSPGAGDVDGDGRVTIVAAASRGAFPAYQAGLLVAIDAVTGEERWRLDIGDIAGGSPLLLDVTGDGRDEIVTTMGGYKQDARSPQSPSRLLILRGVDAQVIDVAEFPGLPVSTPVVVDMDGDGRLEVVTASLREPGVRRFETPFTAPARSGWWKFRGNLANTGRLDIRQP